MAVRPPQSGVVSATYGCRPVPQGGIELLHTISSLSDITLLIFPSFQKEGLGEILTRF